MRLSGIGARVVDPVDRVHLDDLLAEDDSIVSEGYRHDQHEEQLKPKSVLLEYPLPVALKLEVFGQRLLIDEACLDLRQHHSLIKGHRVLVVLPDALKVELEYDANSTHD